MMHCICPVISVTEVAENIFVLAFTSETIARTVRAGQFINIRVDETTDPLLRRPFSVYRAEGDRVEIIFNVIGRGTGTLRKKTRGETIDLLGPLGVPFGIENSDYTTGVLIGGGLGVAPFPLATEALLAAGKEAITFVGARTERALIPQHLQNVYVATDDGSSGYHGTVVDLARNILADQPVERPKIFACGPTAMLKAVGAFALEADIPCEVSLEGPMACGFGICQGCPVELVGAEKKYALMCKDGPTFDVRAVKL